MRRCASQQPAPVSQSASVASIATVIFPHSAQTFGSAAEIPVLSSSGRTGDQDRLTYFGLVWEGFCFVYGEADIVFFPHSAS